MLYYLSILLWLYLGIYKKRRLNRTMKIEPLQWKTDRYSEKTDQYKEIFITFDSQKLCRSMRTFWKAYQVYFPMQQTSPHLDITIKSYAQISQDCSEGQQSFWTECWYNFPCKIVPLYKATWCMLHMDGKLIESTFTLNKQLIILTSH